MEKKKENRNDDKSDKSVNKNRFVPPFNPKIALAQLVFATFWTIKRRMNAQRTRDVKNV